MNLRSMGFLGSAIAAMVSACAEEEWSGDRGIRAGVATITQHEDPANLEEPYRGPVARVEGRPNAGDVRVFLYARNPETGFGPRHWIRDASSISRSQEVGAPLDQPTERGQAEFGMKADARELLVEVKGPGSEETGGIEVYLATHDETAFCIQARLHRRRCVEAGKQDCDAEFLTTMTGHVDTCAAVEGLNPKR